MTISPYQNSVPVSTFTPYLNDVELEAKVLMFKQGSYDQAYQGIQKLRKESLNINFINNKEQRKIDKFNTEINETFNSLNGELGDLSDRSIVKSYTDKFNIIGKDVNLINRYKQDVRYKEELRDVYKKRDSKDPKKQGYHQINHSNYERRLGAYRDADLDEGDVAVAPYVNYLDYNKELKTLRKEVPEEEIIEERNMGDGRTLIITKKGRNKAKIKAVEDAYLGGDAAAQVREEAEFDFYRNKDNPKFKEQLYTESQGLIKNTKTQLQAEVKKLKLGLSGLKDDQLANVSGAIAQYEDNIISLDKQLMDFNDFSEQSDKELINTHSSLYVKNLSESHADAFGGYTHSIEYKTDQAFWNAKNLQRSYSNDAFDRQYKTDKLNLDKAKFKLELQESGLNADGSVVPTETVTSQGVPSSQVSERILTGLIKFTSENKDFLNLGMGQSDLMPPSVSAQVDREIATLEAELQSVTVAGSGAGKDYNTRDIAYSEKTRIKEEISKLQAQKKGLVLSPEQMMEKVVKEPNFFTQQSSVVREAPDVLAMEDAVTEYMRANNIQYRQEVTDYDAVLGLAKEIKKREGSRAAIKFSSNRRAKSTVERMLTKSGLNLQASDKDQKDTWNAYVESQPEMIPHFQSKVYELDLTKLTGDLKGATLTKAIHMKSLINGAIQSVGNDSSGNPLLTKGTLKNDDMLRVEEHKNGSFTVTFNPKSLEEGGNLYGKSIRDLDGYLITPTTGNNRVTISNSAQSTVSLESTLINKISDTDNLKWDVGNGKSYNVMMDSQGNYNYSLSTGETGTIPKRSNLGITNDEQVHKALEHKLK